MKLSTPRTLAAFALAASAAFAVSGCDRRDGMPASPKPAADAPAQSAAPGAGPTAVGTPGSANAGAGGAPALRLADGPVGERLPPMAPPRHDPSLPDASKVFGADGRAPSSGAAGTSGQEPATSRNTSSPDRTVNSPAPQGASPNSNAASGNASPRNTPDGSSPSGGAGSPDTAAGGGDPSSRGSGK